MVQMSLLPKQSHRCGKQMFSDQGKAVGGINWKTGTDTPIYKIGN